MFCFRGSGIWVESGGSEMLEEVSSAVPTPAGDKGASRHGFFADLYSFDWSHLEFRLPLISATSVAMCLLIGVAVGHPSAGLIAGGGAFTIGFGANQRIRDSRIWPMLGATAAMAFSTIVGMLAGHRGPALLLAAAVWGFAYAMLTTQANGVSWVGQQAAVVLMVTSAFPTDLRHALQRAGLTAVGGLLQVVVTSAGLHLLPELGTDLMQVPRTLYTSLYQKRRQRLLQLRHLAQVLPRVSRSKALGYAVRMTLTLVAASELYRRLGVQSGYWIPMTALLVQKPAFFETLTRALLRVTGTILGAVLASVFVVHVQPSPVLLAVLASVCALCGFATNGVNYGLFSLFLTSYIVFLLGLNTMPGPEIAHRRAYCTAFGAMIALVLHLDALRRHRANPAQA